MIDDCYETIRTTPIDSSGQVFHVQTPYGGGNVTLDNALALRAGGMAMAVSGPDPNTPQPGTPAIGDESEVPKFTFFIYDHLGNSRILYTTQLVDCNPDSTKYLLEHVLDYYPYGRTLREYVFNRERFQTTYHERDQETGLDYRGARFYDGDVGRFLSVDPLAADYAAWGTYVYVLDNPIIFIDPDGRQIFPVHGTWSDPNTWKDLDGIVSASNKLFGDDNLASSFQWSGANYAEARTTAALELIDHIRAARKDIDIYPLKSGLRIS